MQKHKTNTREIIETNMRKIIETITKIFPIEFFLPPPFSTLTESSFRVSVPSSFVRCMLVFE
jgi:hypothetical protein